MSSAVEQTISKLRAKLDEIPFEKHSLVPFKGKPVMQRAFFPGGNGLYLGETASHFPFRGTLVLGSNFGAVGTFVDGHERLLTQDEINDPRNGTWPPLRKLLCSAGISLEDCFFTNAWPCLHSGNTNLTGKEKEAWLANVELARECSAFFTVTAAIMQPSLIIALGPAPAAFLAGVWPRQLSKWQKNKTIAMDSLPIATVRINNANHATVCTAVVHPSYSHINSGHRKPPYRGVEGEIELIRQASALRRSQSPQ